MRSKQLFEAFAASSALSQAKTRSLSAENDLVNFEVLWRMKNVGFDFVKFLLSFRNQDTTGFKNTKNNYFYFHGHFNFRSNYVNPLYIYFLRGMNKAYYYIRKEELETRVIQISAPVSRNSSFHNGPVKL